MDIKTGSSEPITSDGAAGSVAAAIVGNRVTEGVRRPAQGREVGVRPLPSSVQ